MQIPNLPHDNLYKFIAFSGLALMLFVSYMFFTKTVELSDDWIKLEGQSRDLVRTSEPLRAQIDSVKKRMTELEKLPADRRGAEIDAIGKALAEMGPGTAEMNKKADEVKTQEELLKMREVDLKLIKSSFKAGNILGLIFLIVGLGLWYVRVQRPQDQLLKTQLSAERTRRNPRLQR